MTLNSSLVRCSLACLVLLVSCLVVIESAHAQSDDPCLSELSGSDLERYDDFVGRYLEARDENDARAQLATLDQLEKLCSSNLRLAVYRGDALRDLDRCGDAVEQYQDVMSRASNWPDPNHGKDAKVLAEEGFDSLLDSCLARVRITCKTPGSTVQVGTRPAQRCDEVLHIPSGKQSIVVSASGFHSRTESIELFPGNNNIIFDSLKPVEKAGQVAFECEDLGVEIVVGQDRFTCPTTWSFPTGPIAYQAFRPPPAEPLMGQITVVHDQVVSVVIPSAGQAQITEPDPGPEEDGVDFRLRLLGGGGFVAFEPATTTADGGSTPQGDTESAYFGNIEAGFPVALQAFGGLGAELGLSLRIGFAGDGLGILGLAFGSFVWNATPGFELGLRLGLGYGSLGLPVGTPEDETSNFNGFVFGAGVIPRIVLTESFAIAALFSLNSLFLDTTVLGLDLGIGFDYQF